MGTRKIHVYISLRGQDVFVGKLWFYMRKHRESASFEYSQAWLEHPERFALEPALRLSEGVYHTQEKIPVFGAIGDSAPDRWGRVLMRRAHSLRKTDGGALATLSEADYLLSVCDEARQGALRFALPEQEKQFLAEKRYASTMPPLVLLPELLAATDRLIADEAGAQDIKMLLAPGSSLGGARPKAVVKDVDGQLALAKFPRKDDEHNLVAWEAVALALAQQAGLAVPGWRLEYITDKPVLIVRRFDRRDSGHRVPFISAMSLLDAADNEQRSYLEIALMLSQHGAHVEQDLRELWSRIVFSILIANTDDHLRNHGFLYVSQKGWRLSPLYDVNPTPEDIKPRILSTAIDMYDTSACLETALAVAKEFRLHKPQAEEIIKRISSAIDQWQVVATHYGLSKKECDYMASAFQYKG